MSRRSACNPDDQGIEATVKADGQTLRINSFICGRVFLTNEFEQGHDILRAMKFKRITCNNGLETAWVDL
jgi:hypothetical protein